MRRIFYSRFGGPEFCSLNTRPFPSLAPDRSGSGWPSCGVNPIDFKTRSGLGFVSQTLGQRFHLCPVMMSAAWWTP